MTEPAIDPREAAEALAAVRSTQRRSAEFRGYAVAGDHLIAWGLVWIAGNLAAQFVPAKANIVWGLGIAAAVLFQLIRARAARGRNSGRVFATVATGLGFAFVAVAVADIAPARQTAFASLLVAAIYIGMGIWVGARYAWLGLFVAVVVLIGRFLLPDWMPLCLAVGGGGAFLLSGLWLRRA